MCQVICVQFLERKSTSFISRDLRTQSWKKINSEENKFVVINKFVNNYLFYLFLYDLIFIQEYI
jgi:hypothetical protein